MGTAAASPHPSGGAAAVIFVKQPHPIYVEPKHPRGAADRPVERPVRW